MAFKICVTCGKEFKPRHPEQITCSEECRAAYKKARRYALYHGQLEPGVTSLRRRTLCWKCAKATKDLCAWCRDRKPVEGWEAIPTTHDSNSKTANNIMHSYCVIKCPEFVRG